MFTITSIKTFFNLVGLEVAYHKTKKNYVVVVDNQKTGKNLMKLRRQHKLLIPLEVTEEYGEENLYNHILLKMYDYIDQQMFNYVPCLKTSNVSVVEFLKAGGGKYLLEYWNLFKIHYKKYRTLPEFIYNETGIPRYMLNEAYRF